MSCYHLCISLITDFVVDHISTTSSDITITPNTGTLSFLAGSATSTESVSITASIDNTIEGHESLLVKLVDPMGSSCTDGNREDPYILKVRILENDGMKYISEWPFHPRPSGSFFCNNVPSVVGCGNIRHDFLNLMSYILVFNTNV